MNKGFHLRGRSRIVRILLLLAPGVAMLPGPPAAARFPEPVVRTVEEAIAANPEVLAARQQLFQFLEQREVERGRYYPRIDAEGYVGHRWYREDYRGRPEADYDHDEQRLRLALVQNLYDGLGTTSSVARAGHLADAQRLDLLNTISNVALESLRAHLDVIRYRRMVEEAERNLERHRKLWSLIEARVEKGVSNRVDLELASSRLELARLNLDTERTNLFDVSSRYTRIVGHAPAARLAEVRVDPDRMPPSAGEGLARAYAANPGLQATEERIRAAHFGVEEQRARFRPTLDLVGAVERSWDQEGLDGHEQEASIGLLARYNLFRGFSDQARQRQATHALGEARDRRILACRNLQQEFLVAYNEARNLERQLGHIRKRVEHARRSRDNYYRQFRIGRRTLLDLLDQENEYYQASRTLISVETDLEIARLRTLAAMGELLEALGLRRVEPEPVRDLREPESLEPVPCPPAPAYALAE